MNCPSTSATDVRSLLAALKECGKKADLRRGRRLHLEAAEARLHRNKYVAAALISMYSRCREMANARTVFDSMPERNVVLWTSLILGYAEFGEGFTALELYINMDCQADPVTFVAAIKACSALAAEELFRLEKGVVIHKQAMELGFHSDIFVSNALVDFYSRCRSMYHARAMFNSMQLRDVVSWNSLIMGYVENGEPLTSIGLFWNMDCEPNSVTFVAVLKACASLGRAEPYPSFGLATGMAVHARAKERGYDEQDLFVANTLMDMYSKCRSLENARAVLDNMLVTRDAVSWNILMLGYVENGHSLTAMDVFSAMDCEPTSLTVVIVLKACSTLSANKQLGSAFCMEKGMSLHKDAILSSRDGDVLVATALVDMYGKCMSMRHARSCFNKVSHPDTVLWNNLLLGYVENSEALVGLELYTCMECELDSVSVVAALKACAALARGKEFDKRFCLEKGMCVHKRAKDRRLEGDLFVAATLVEMYSNCGRMTHARAVFDSMTLRNVVLWNSLLLGYVENGESCLAMELFTSMTCEPDTITFVAALKACAGMSAAAAVGRRVHVHICKLGLEQDQSVANSLLDFYSRCGVMTVSEHIFAGMASSDTVSWNSLISGYSRLGQTSHVSGMLERLRESGLNPDEVTILLALTTCSHAGRVEQGKKHFESMSKYGLRPSMEHYCCMVDMLGRANRLEEAVATIRSMPFRANVVAWTSLLGACRRWSHNNNNLEMSKLAFEELMSYR